MILPVLISDPSFAVSLLPKGPLATSWNSYKVLGLRLLIKYVRTEPGTTTCYNKQNDYYSFTQQRQQTV